MSNSAKIKRGDKMSEQITITMTREELIEIIEKVAIREKFFIRNSVKLSIADAILSAGSQKKRKARKRFYKDDERPPIDADDKG